MSPDAPVPHVLIAEDDRTVAYLLARSIEGLGWSVTSAYDGLHALALGLEQDFDLILLDMMLPGMLGPEVMQRWADAGRQSPVMFISAVHSDEEIVRSLELGAVDFIRKPFSVPELLARAKAHVRKP